MIILDTNALIRFLTNDIPTQARQVHKLLEEEDAVFVPDVVFPELEYVLCGRYEVTRAEFVHACKTLLAQPNIHTTATMGRALELFANSSFDMADCIIAASVDVHGSLASFDKKLVRKTRQGYWK